MKIPAKTKKEIETAIAIRAKAKAMETEAKNLTFTAKETLIPIMEVYNLKQAQVEGIGKVFLKTSKGSAINAGKLREMLLVFGHGVEEVNNIIESASSSWETKYIEFKGE